MKIKRIITLGKGDISLSTGTIKDSDSLFLGFSSIESPKNLKSGDDLPEDVVIKDDLFFAVVFENKKSAEVFRMEVNELLEKFEEKENGDD